MKIPFHMRLDCPNSFGIEDSFHLRCEVGGGVCDGTLWECCMWDKSFSEQLTIIQGLMKLKGGEHETITYTAHGTNGENISWAETGGKT